MPRPYTQHYCALLTWFFDPRSPDRHGGRARRDGGAVAPLRPRQVGSLAPRLKGHLEQLERGALDVFVDQALLCGRRLTRVGHVVGVTGNPGGGGGRGLFRPFVLVLVQDHPKGLGVAQVSLGGRLLLLEVYAVEDLWFFFSVRRRQQILSEIASNANVKQIAALKVVDTFFKRQMAPPFETFRPENK